MHIKHLILALLFALAAAASIYVRHAAPVQISDGEHLCRHAITTGNVLLAKHCT